MFCEKCGNKLEDGARFCGGCGNMITQPAPAANQPDGRRKKRSGKKAVIGICAAASVLAICMTFAIIAVAKKADKVTKIIKAYDDTINAENFDVRFRVGGYGLILEVFGKGDVADAYMARFDYNDSNNWLKNIDEDYLEDGIHGDVYYSGGRFIDAAADWYAYDEYQMIADRDFAGLWDHEMGGVLGLDYDDAYNMAVDVVLEYVKNRNAGAVKKISISDDTYTLRLDINDFAKGTEYSDTVEDVILRINDNFGVDVEELIVEVALDGKYLSSISAAIASDDEDEFPLLGLDFANVNQLTKKTSVACEIFDGR